MARQRAAQCFGESGHRLGLPREQMLKESRGSPYRLTCVVEDVVESRQALEQKAREELDTGGVSEIEAVNLESFAKGREIRLFRVTVGRIDREARRDDHMRAGT